jgi:acetolactate synthase I/II/III large subunit
MNTAQAIVNTFRIQGIERIFCLPGVQNDPFFDALYDLQDTMQPIHARHEQGTAYMALGAALATGKPQVYCVVPGPGFLNSTAALATAYSCNAKVLALVGEIPSASIGKGFGLLHEIPDQLGVLRSLTKWAERIEEPEAAARLTREAFLQMLSGRPRPVGLECPMDVWNQEAEITLPQTPISVAPPPIDDDAVRQAAQKLGHAHKPLIVVGGGAQDASEEVQALAEMLQAPVIAFRNGRGVLDSRHELSHTLPAGHVLWRDADVVLAIGTRLQPQQMSWGLDDALQIIRVDIDVEEMNRIAKPAVGLVGDATGVLRRLLDVLPSHNNVRPSRKDEMLALKAEMASHFAQLQPQLSYIDAMRAELPEEGIFVDELTQVGYVSRFTLPVYQPRTFLSTAYQGTLGWGVAAAIGAKLACPDKPVLSIAGDGGFMYNVQELSTAVRHHVPVVMVVFNDGAYGNVLRIQQQQFSGRTIASDLVNPDFVKLAESFGVLGLKATTPAALRQALRQAWAANMPVLIEVPCGEMPSPWEFTMLPRARPA